MNATGPGEQNTSTTSNGTASSSDVESVTKGDRIIALRLTETYLMSLTFSRRFVFLEGSCSKISHIITVVNGFVHS